MEEQMNPNFGQGGGDQGYNRGVKRRAPDNVAPSKVLHVRAIPPGTKSEQLLSYVRPFGQVIYVSMIPKYNQALVEMESIEAATAFLEQTRQQPIIVNGEQVFFNFSRSPEIRKPMDTSTKPMDPAQLASGNSLLGGPAPHAPVQSPQRILMLTILNPIYTITVDVLHTIMSPFGHVQRIVMFEKKGVQALVEFERADMAASAMSALEGKDIYDGCCTLRIMFSDTDRLNVRFNNERSRDYTVDLPPNNPMNMDPRQMGGMNMQRQGFDPRMGGFDQMGDMGMGDMGNNQGFPQGFQGPGQGRFGGFQQGMQQGPFGMGMEEERCVLMVYNVDSSLTCDHVFNLFCLYGNVMRVKRLPSEKKEAVMVQMGNQMMAQTARQYLEGAVVAGKAIEIIPSKHVFIGLSRGDREALDGESSTSATFKMFEDSQANRFLRRAPDPSRMFPPTHVVHFSNANPEFTTIEVWKSIFADLGVKEPIDMVKFDMSKRAREAAARNQNKPKARPWSNKASGLLQFADVSQATDALVYGNNHFKDGSTIKLSFSENEVDHSREAKSVLQSE